MVVSNALRVCVVDVETTGMMNCTAAVVLMVQCAVRSRRFLLYDSRSSSSSYHARRRTVGLVESHSCRSVALTSHPSRFVCRAARFG